MSAASRAAAALCALASVPALAEPGDGVVRIGVLTDMAGPSADIGGAGSVAAVELAVDDHGRRAAGLPVEVLSADHQNKPDIATAIAGRWIEVERVDAFANLIVSSVALAVSELGRRHQRVVLVSGAATSALTGPACSPFTAHWTYDTWALANTTGRAIVAEGGTTWHFLAVDYALGEQFVADTSAAVTAAGGRVEGVTRFPFNNADFSSSLLNAQASGAAVVALAAAGQDAVNAIKQAHEFGIVDGGQRLAALILFLTDVDALGLETAQGLQFTTAFYWDHTAATRAWSARFEARTGRKPTQMQAGDYSSVLHYLKAVEAAGTDEAQAVMAAMRRLPIEDMMTLGGRLRADGRVLRPLHLVEVKAPAQSSGRWDSLRILRTLPPDRAFRPEGEGGCTPERLALPEPASGR